MKLVIYEDNWADELDVEGFRVFFDHEWMQILNGLNDPERYPETYCFGSNEEIEYESPIQILATLEAKDISNEEYEMLCNLFNNGLPVYKDERPAFGYFPYFVFDAGNV